MMNAWNLDPWPVPAATLKLRLQSVLATPQVEPITTITSATIERTSRA